MKWLPTLALLATISISSADWRVTATTDLGELPKGATVQASDLDNDGLSARLTAVVFPSKAFSLRVVDSPSPGKSKLAATLAAAGCIAGVNGGYFHDDFRPVGLMVADGKEIHPFEQAKLLSGILAVRDRRIEIVRSSKFSKTSDLRQAIQCGPMLVEGGKPTVGLNDERSARRTVVATDGHGQWALIYLTSVTLADTAQILTLPGLLDGWTTATALNLDGGSSSGLWAAGTPVSLPEFGHVRNFIGIAPR